VDAGEPAPRTRRDRTRDRGPAFNPAARGLGFRHRSELSTVPI